MTPIGVWGVFVSMHPPEMASEQARTGGESAESSAMGRDSGCLVSSN
jgi:hypothetical protein